jgi:CPA1 family monovalent cation:H+ antiporter
VPVLSQVVVILVLLAAAFLFAQIAYHAGMPSAAAIVLVGIAANGMLPRDIRIELTPATLALFLPALIFEGAWSIDVVALRGAALSIAVLAVPGVLVTCAIIACAGVAIGGMALPAAFALGATLSATDPIAVLALFRALHVPTALLTIVEGESIANDGVAAILVQMSLLAALGGLHGVGAMWLPGLYSPLAGIAIGVAFARVLGPIGRRFPGPSAGIVATVAIAYGSYGLATLAGGSGIFASAAAGIALPQRAPDSNEVLTVERFWDRIAFVANAIVFLLVGLSLRLERIFAEPRLLAATVAAVVVSRLLLAYALVPIRHATGPRNAWRHAVALSGIRGGLSLALALGLPYDFPDRAELIDAVFAVVFLTLVVQGWTLAPLLRRLRLGAPAYPFG